MEQCPECRSPIHSLMLLKGDNSLELYCGVCDRGWPIPRRTRKAPRRRLAAAR